MSPIDEKIDIPDFPEEMRLAAAYYKFPRHSRKAVGEILDHATFIHNVSGQVISGMQQIPKYLTQDSEFASICSNLGILDAACDERETSSENEKLQLGRFRRAQLNSLLNALKRIREGSANQFEILTNPLPDTFDKDRKQFADHILDVHKCFYSLTKERRNEDFHDYCLENPDPAGSFCYQLTPEQLGRLRPIQITEAQKDELLRLQGLIHPHHLINKDLKFFKREIDWTHISLLRLPTGELVILNIKKAENFVYNMKSIYQGPSPSLKPSHHVFATSIDGNSALTPSSPSPDVKPQNNRLQRYLRGIPLLRRFLKDRNSSEE